MSRASDCECAAPPIRAILVIDDHPLYSSALETALRHVLAPREIRAVTSLGEAVAALEDGFSPDLVMLDLRLPDVIGISGFLQLRARMPEVPILVISALARAEVVQAVMSAGAAGFVPKDADAPTLHRAIARVRDGDRFVPGGFDLGKMGGEPPSTQAIARRIAELTPQQSRIIRLICAGKPNKQIAYELSLAEATVKAHITALLRRLGVQNRTQAAVLVETALLGTGGEMSDVDARSFLEH